MVVEGEGFKVFSSFFDAYFKERDLNALLGMVSERVISLGTGVHEVGVGKDEFERLCRAEFATNSAPMDYEILRAGEFRLSDTAIVFLAKMKIFLIPFKIASPPSNSFDSRFTGTCVLQDGKWLIESMHMSLPSTYQEEGVFFPNFHHGNGVTISADDMRQIVSLSLLDIFPCGIMCTYREKGLPFYLVNDEFLRYAGYTYDEFLVATGGMAINIVHPDDREMVQDKVLEVTEFPQAYEAQFRLLKKDGSFAWAYTRGKSLKLADGRDIFVSMTINISKMVAVQEKLSNEASRDVLTPLLNRRAMIKQVEASFAHSQIGCFFIIDVDNFKQMNDTLGHQAGDDILKDLAAILLKRTRESDIAARLGGDEFAIYYPGLKDPAVAKTRSKQIREDFRKIARQKYGAENVSLSIGSVFRFGNMDFAALYRNADKALYAVKRGGKGGYIQYQNSEEADGYAKES